MELTQEARAARALRDELDILRERANKVHLLESERESYKDKMSQMESLKCRIDEVREENKILLETKDMLETQLHNSRRLVFFYIFSKELYLCMYVNIHYTAYYFPVFSLFNPNFLKTF